jgi:HEAT repeat protein
MNQDDFAIRLANALNDTDPEVRLAAIATVMENQNITLNDAALDALMQCLGASRKIFQRRAAEALSALSIREPRVVEKLRAMLSHPESHARWGVAYALGLVTLDGALDLQSMPVLIEALSSSDGDVRWAAAELVVRLGRKHPDNVSNQLIALAASGNLNARKMALYCLRDVGGPREELLAAAESCVDDHQSLLKMAALSLLSRLQNSDDRVAALAIRLLEKDPDGGVRRCAAVALGHIGNRSSRVTEALTRAANIEDDIYMKRAAEGALARLGASV